MLSKEVQDLVDKSRQARDMIKSVDAGMGALRKQNEEMKAKLDAIASQPTPAPSDANQGAPGQVEYRLSQEDLDALREVSQGFDDTIESLKDDIPANVAQPNTEPEMPNEPPKAEEGGAPQEASSDQSSPTPTDEEKQPEAPMGHQADADAASQAKPLDGTGAPTEEQKQDPAA